MIKVMHGARRDQLLGDVGTALGIRTETALVVGGYFNTNGDIS
jgi:hypothetical protein